MWEGGCLLLWEGVIWLARLGMHLRGESLREASVLIECSGCGRWSGGCDALARERQGASCHERCDEVYEGVPANRQFVSEWSSF